MLDQFVDIHQQSLFEKMLMFGSFAKFIICDESQAFAHLIEWMACADIGFVTAILRNKGSSVTWMNSDIAAERTYMNIFPYMSDDESVLRATKLAMQWAMRKVKDRADFYNQPYPWRNKNVRVG